MQQQQHASYFEVRYVHCISLWWDATLMLVSGGNICVKVVDTRTLAIVTLAPQHLHC